VKPLGNRVRIEMAAFYTFDSASGKLLAEKIYYDQAGRFAADARKTRVGGGSVVPFSLAWRRRSTPAALM
jgi:hypothetical protein